MAVGAIALSALLQVAVVHLPILNLAFGTAPLTVDQWLLCAAMASVVLWYSELRKLAGRSGSAESRALAAPQGHNSMRRVTPRITSSLNQKK